MNWDNNRLINFILDRSTDLDYVMKTEPEKPQENPLAQANISLRELEFSKEVLDYLDGTSLSDEKNYVAKTVRMQIKGSAVDYYDLTDYSEEDIEEYHQYLIDIERVREINNEIYSQSIENIPKFAFLYDRYNNKNVLIFSNANYNPLAVGLTEMERLIDNNLGNKTRYYRELDRDTILEEIDNIDFNSLRSRLIEAGYIDTVNELDEEISNY